MCVCVVVVDSDAVSESSMSMSLTTDTADHPPQHEHLLTAVNHLPTTPTPVSQHDTPPVSHDITDGSPCRPVTPDDDDDDMFDDAVETWSRDTQDGDWSRDGGAAASWRWSWCVLIASSSLLLAVLLMASVAVLVSLVVLESDVDLSLVHSLRRLPELCHFYRDHYLPWRSHYLPWRRAVPPQSAAQWRCLTRTKHRSHDDDDDDDDDDEVSETQDEAESHTQQDERISVT